MPVAMNAGGGHPNGVDEFVGLPKVFREALGARRLVSPLGQVGLEVFGGRGGQEGGFHPGFKFIESLFEVVEVDLGIVEHAKVSRGDVLDGQGAKAGKALPPLFEVELGRGGGDANVIHAGEADAADVTSKTEVIEEVRHVVRGVAGGVEGGELEAADGDGVAIREGGKFIGRDGEEISPQGFHAVAINAFCAGEEAFGVEHVGRANEVNVDVCALLGEPTCRASMVEVDVGEENVGNVGGGEGVLFEGDGEGLDGGARAGFDEDTPVGVRNEEGGNGLGSSLEVQIEDVDGGHGDSEGGL